MFYRYLFLFLFVNFTNCNPCQVNNRTDVFRTKSGDCVTCSSYCNHRTDVCLYQNQLRRLCSTLHFSRNIRDCQQKITPEIVHSFLLLNSTKLFDEDIENSDEPVCLFCGKFTRGLRCEYCRQRPNDRQLQYLLDLRTPFSTCFECACSGQTYDCRTNMTDGCGCLSHLLDPNLVESNLYQCLSNRTNIPNQLQSPTSKVHQRCRNCQRGYSGVTSERGHQCYKLLSTNTTQCFEYNHNLKACLNYNEIVKSENNGTILFEVAPSYRNLNIRVLIGIEYGFVDVICSIRNANFIISNDHRVYYEHQSLTDIEPTIRDYDLTDEDYNYGVLYSDPSDIVILRNLSSKHRVTLLVSPTNIDFTQDNLRCILVDQPRLFTQLTDSVSPSSQSITFSLSDYRAIHLTTGSSVISSKTYGFIKIYQSRMNIDLFVFFSVFFSSFFLFLSVGICFWKVKFAYEIHRRRRTLKHEYHRRMARPFAKIQLYIKPSAVVSNDDLNSQQLPSPNAASSVDIPLLLPSTRTDIDYSPHVVSVEPLRDQNNCYTTLLFHLPGDLSTQYRLCAGTTLTKLPIDYANALSNARIEADLRKRNKYKRRSKRKMKMRGEKPMATSTTTTALSAATTAATSTRQQQQRRRKQQSAELRTTTES